MFIVYLFSTDFRAILLPVWLYIHINSTMLVLLCFEYNTYRIILKKESQNH